jgi:hypothetical protein
MSQGACYRASDMDSDLLECEELILSSPNGPTDPSSDFYFGKKISFYLTKITQNLDFFGKFLFF